MANIWIKVAGNDGTNDTFLVVENNHFFSASNIIYKSISFREDTQKIEFSALKGDDFLTSDIYLRETINVSEGFGNQSLLNRILFFFIKHKTIIEIYTIRQKDGKIQTTLTYGNHKKSFTIFTLSDKATEDNKTTGLSSLPCQSKEATSIDETKVFLKEHVHAFSSLLEETFLCSSHYVTDSTVMTKWKGLITSLPNSTMFNSLFDRCNNNVALWLNTLNTLGIQRDKCKKYSVHTLSKDKYHTPNELTKEYYTVIMPCWIYSPDGESQSIILVKGFVE